MIPYSHPSHGDTFYVALLGPRGDIWRQWACPALLLLLCVWSDCFWGERVDVEMCSLWMGVGLL